MPTTVQLVKLSALQQIQTDLAATVAGSAAAALNSQNAAAASAATALNAQATEYLGAIAGTAVPATVTTKGQYYLITTAGTSPNVPAINWTVGDKAVYNGTSGSWSRITGFLAASNSYAESVGAARVGSGYLYSDGATSVRGQIQTLSSRSNLAGASLASWVGWVDVPASNPSGDTQIFSLSGTISANPWAASSLYANIAASGNLSITQVNTTLSNRRNFDYGGFRAAYSGQRIWLEVRFVFGSSDPVVRVNGINISLLFSASNAGAFPNWLDSGTPGTYALSGINWPAGVAPLGCWINTHLSDAESEAWRITGRPPFWVQAGGSQIDVKPTSSSFAYWFGVGSVVSSTATQVVTAAGAANLNVRNPALTVTPLVGSKVVINATISGLTGALTFGLTTYSLSATASNVTADGTYDLAITPNSSGQGFVVIGLSSTTQTTVTINSVRLVGALSLPAVQPIAVLDDVTALGGNQARLVGMAPVCDRRDWRIVAPTATNGNQQLLGGALIAEPERNRIDSWVVNNTGAATRTVSLGQSSGAPTYVNAASCPVGRTEITLATRFPAAGQPNLWANSNGIDNLTHTITGHRVEA